MENKKVKLLSITQGNIIKKQEKEIERFNYLEMVLIACKSINYGNYIALIEKDTGYLVYETDCKTAKECLERFKKKAKINGLTKDKTKEVIYNKVKELTKLGIETPVNK